MYPYINVNIDNKKYKLLVDTGSNRTIVFRFKSGLGFGCRKMWIRFKTFLLPSYKVNVGIKSNNVQLNTNILVVDWQKYLEYARDIVKNIGIYSYFQKFDYDGILGLDLLKKTTLRINCANNISSFMVSKNSLIQQMTDEHVNSLTGIKGHIAVRIDINGKRYCGIVDTGIDVCDIVIPKRISGLQKIRTKYIWLWNSKKLVIIYKLKSDAQILNKRFRNLRFVVLRISDNVDSPIICYPLLQKFKTIIFEKCEKIYAK